MACILHVDHLHGWRAVLRRALPDHHVDVAGSGEEALGLLQDGTAFHLALVDLGPDSDADTVGIELLELLRARHPGTRPIVVVAVPPPDTVRDDLLERFGVEEILIISETGEPDLRHVIEDALGQAVPADARLRRAELHRRYQKWQHRVGAELDSRLRAAELFVRNGSTISPGSRRPARVALENARALREQFRADSAAIAGRIDRSASAREVLDATDAFEHVEGLYADFKER